MDTNKNQLSKLINHIKKSSNYSIKSSEEYYYALGQLITYVFINLGGIDKHRREFNYLTNPIQSQSIFVLGKRNIKFLKKIIDKVNLNDLALKIIRILESYQLNFYFADIGACSEAFYEGLYSDNHIM